MVRYITNIQSLDSLSQVSHSLKYLLLDTKLHLIFISQVNTPTPDMHLISLFPCLNSEY